MVAESVRNLAAAVPQTYSAFCHQLQRYVAAGSIISVMPVIFRSWTVAFFPYIVKCGTPGSFGFPVSAKCVMYSCSAIAIGVLKTELDGPL